VLLGLGTAIYPTLPASIGDVAHPSGRASAAGIYRSRAISAMQPTPCSGVTANLSAFAPRACWSPLLTFASGTVGVIRMKERLGNTSAGLTG
jgi:hypothetical protein